MVYAIAQAFRIRTGGGMNRRNVILVSLGALELLVAAVAFVILGWTESEWTSLVCAAVFYAQPYLLGIWIAFGQRTLPWRMVAVAITSTCLTHCLVPYMAPWFIAVLSPGIPVILGVLLLARILGPRFYDSSTTTPPDDSPKFQFSLCRMLEWTAAVAALCSMAAIAPPDVYDELDSFVTGEPLILVAIHGLLGGISLAFVAAILGMRCPWLGVGVLGAAGLLAAYLLHRVLGAEPSEMFLFIVCFMLWLTLCLVPVRLFGYRYGRRRLATAPPFACDEPGECPFQEPSDSAEGVVAQ